MKPSTTSINFERWYASEHGRVSATVLAFYGNVDLAQEATDVAFARAWQQWSKVSVMTSPGAWTQRVALNAARRAARRKAVERILIAKQVPREVVEIPDSWIWDLVRRLPNRQRTAVVLRYAGDWPEAEIAEVLKVSRGTVSASLVAARRTLAAALDTTTVGVEQ